MYEYCQIRDFAEIMPDIMYQSYIDGCPWNHAGTRNGGCGGRPKKEGEVAMAIAKGLKRMFGNKQVLEFICGAINDKQADDMKPANRRQQMRGQRDALTSLHVPEDDEKILRVVSVKGANLYELTDGENHVGLYTLPKALRHVVAIRPGSYVIAAAYSHREGRVNGEIIHVPMKPHVDYLRKLPCWPTAFTSGNLTEETTIGECRRDLYDEEEEDDGTDLQENTNRRRWTDEETDDDAGEDDEDDDSDSSANEACLNLPDDAAPSLTPQLSQLEKEEK